MCLYMSSQQDHSVVLGPLETFRAKEHINDQANHALDLKYGNNNNEVKVSFGLHAVPISL